MNGKYGNPINRIDKRKLAFDIHRAAQALRRLNFNLICIRLKKIPASKKLNGKRPAKLKTSNWNLLKPVYANFISDNVMKNKFCSLPVDCLNHVDGGACMLRLCWLYLAIYVRRCAYCLFALHSTANPRWAPLYSASHSKNKYIDDGRTDEARNEGGYLDRRLTYLLWIIKKAVGSA